MGLFQLVENQNYFSTAFWTARKFYLKDVICMSQRGPTQNQKQGQALQPISQHELAVQTAKELVNTQKRLGLSLTIHDQNLNNISGKFDNMADLMRNPEYISRSDQVLYISSGSERTWFKMTVKNGNIKAISFLLTFLIRKLRIINYKDAGYDSIIVNYEVSEGRSQIFTAVIPRTDLMPNKIIKHFPQLVGQTANDTKEIGKLICYMVSQHLLTPKSDELEYYGFKQGFFKNLKGTMQFNPAKSLPSELEPYLPRGLLEREYPRLSWSGNESQDISQYLNPLFEDRKKLQISLLFRVASWLQSFFAAMHVYSDNTLIIKLGPGVPAALPVALLKNIRYDSFDVPSVGPNIKQLKFNLETVNDGMVVAADLFAADQVKKAEKGYDLLINDTGCAAEDGKIVHHISALISNYADLYFPSDCCCVLDLEGETTETSPNYFAVSLKCLDNSIVVRTEHGCNDGDFKTVFNSHIKIIRNQIPDSIPMSKQNTYIMLMTALRMYNEWYTPLFCPDIEQYIVDWLSSQEQERQPLYDVICSEYGKILNQKIADGYFRLIPKEEVTPYDKGTHTIVIDKEERRIYIETADSFAIAHDEMMSVTDTDSLTAALYSCGYLPHNAKKEKSIRIAAITSDGIPYPLYVHAIKYTLLTQENRQCLELIDKEAYLFKYDEIPEGFLPLIKTVDGRFAGKMIRYAAEDNNNYFGTGRTGSGKSWAVAQLMLMLFMLKHTVIVFDVSNSYSREKLMKILPANVVEKLFKFINVGPGKDPVPVDLGSLRGCESLPDKKRAIYSVLRAATGSIDKSTSRNLKGFLSEYLKDKSYSVSFSNLCFELNKNPNFGTEVADRIYSVFTDIGEIGYEQKTWNDLFSHEHKIIVINLGNEVGDSNHQLLDMLVGSLFNWQMSHDSGFLSIAIDELIDQDFSTGSPLQTIVKQGRKFHTALIGATQDYYNQGSSHLDTMKQANIKSFCRPGKSEDRVAQKLGYSNAVDAGFNKFKAGDTILEFDGYNKETGENEALTMKGRVVNFIESPLYEKFKEIYGC